MGIKYAPKFVPIPNGTKLNKWTVVSYIKHSTYWCKCECGTLRKLHGNRDFEVRKSCRKCTRNPDYKFLECFQRYSKQASSRGLGFSLNAEQARALFQSNCSYCGVQPSAEIRKNRHTYTRFFYNGIDRIDNSLGYSPDNCVSCCGVCNHMKHVLSREDFLNHITRIYEHQKGV